MTTGIVRPNAEYNCNWNGPASNCYDAVTQPTAGDGQYCECDLSDDGLIQEFSMSTLPSVEADSITQIVVWIYGYAEDAGVQPELDIYFEGGYETAQTCTFTTSDSWKSYTFSGLSGSQADLDALRVRFTAAPDVGNKDEWWLDVMYCDVTYTEAAAPEAKGFAQTATGSYTVNTPYRELKTAITGAGAMAVLTPFRDLGFGATGAGSLTVVNPYREMGFNATGTGDGVFILLADKAFFATGAGSDVFGYQTIGATMVYFEATGTGSDSFTTPYKTMGFTDEATGTTVLLVPYQDMGILDESASVAEFIKSVLGDSTLVLIYIEPQHKVNITSAQRHYITTSQRQNKIYTTSERITE